MSQKTKFPVSLGNLEKAVGITKPAISRILRGKSRPKAEHIKPLADALGMTMDAFMRTYVLRKAA